MDSSKQRIERIADSLNRRDWDGYRHHFAADLLVEAPGGSSTGRDARVQWAQDTVAAFPDARASVTEVFGAGDRICAELVFEGTHTGPLPSPSGVIPPTNKAVRFPYCLVLRVAGDEVAELHEYFDQLQLMAQLGLIARA